MFAHQVQDYHSTRQGVRATEIYLPNNDFIAAVANDLGGIAFAQNKYADAERWYGDAVARKEIRSITIERMSSALISDLPPPNQKLSPSETHKVVCIKNRSNIT